MSPARGNLFEALPDDTREELVEQLASGGGARVERIVSTGQSSPEGFWYDQAEDELVVLVCGAAVLEIEHRDEPVEMSPGDWTLLPAHCRHRVAWTSPDEATVWLAVHLPPVISTEGERSEP